MRMALAIALLAVLPVAATPVDTVRELFTRYAAGDARGAAALFVDGEAFLRQHGRRLERRCMRLEALTVHADPHDPSRIETAQTLALRAGDSPEWLETARSRFTLQHDGTAWRIAAWASRDAEAIEQFGGAIADVPVGQTTTVVRLLATRSVEMANQRRLEEALALSDAAMRIAGRLGDPGSLAAAAGARSVVLRIVRMTELEPSVELAHEAVSMAEASGDPDLIARALYRLVRALESLDGIPDLEAMQRAMSLAGQLEDASLAPLLATHLSRAFEMRSASREAFHYATLAVQYAGETSDASARINAAAIMAGNHIAIGNLRVAMRHYQIVRDLSREAGFPGSEAVGIGGMAMCAGTREESIRIVEDGLRTVLGPDREWLLRTHAGLLNAAGRYREAARSLEEAVAVLPPDAEARQNVSIVRASIAESASDYEAALRHLDEARGPNVVFDRDARRRRAELLSCLGRRDEARTLLEELTAELQSVPVREPRRLLFASDDLAQQRLLVRVLLDSADVYGALEAAEQMKALYLRNALENKGAGHPGTMTAPERQQESALESRLRTLQRELYTNHRPGVDRATLRNQLADARAALIEFRQHVFSTRPPDAGTALPRRTLDVDALPPHLDDVTFLVYVGQRESTFVFAVAAKRGGRRTVTVHPVRIGERDLAARVRRFTSLIEQRNLRSDEASAEMYDLLLAPLAPVLREAKTLGIIPDASLWHLPFHALAPRGGAPLIEKVPVFYAPSLGVLAAAGPARAASRVLAMANPLVGAKTASLYRSGTPDAVTGPIPEAESEVRAISRIYGEAHSRVYVGSEARESVLKREAPRYDVLHIATHGLMHQQAPMFSSLLLTTTPDEADDGLLEAREIAELELDADLAVLSACETGKAEELNGDGVIGLSWALLAAGVRTTVVSQWKAQSAVTATLMIELHRRLARGLSKPQALREAQLAVRAQRAYRHPFYWAPFVVIGAP
ncbi:MAG TPA: CHAT domain-containing tetratricopeptide repeat protein [Thermoanaerobaculia bacterium]|nr:CHAT domain-containing tetratricopeptide repeat protein [Thermoanaerobaculia bacterium]